MADTDRLDGVDRSCTGTVLVLCMLSEGARRIDFCFRGERERQVGN